METFIRNQQKKDVINETNDWKLKVMDTMQVFFKRIKETLKRKMLYFLFKKLSKLATFFY